jgi:small subunit ribosomal protein S16
MIKLRLARRGSKKKPFYSIVAADARCPRDGRFLEKIGTYNPLVPKDNSAHVHVNAERAQYWLGVGAQPSECVARLLARAQLIATPNQHVRPNKSAPKKKAQERMKMAQAS